MADIASELASKCGISADAARKGLGVILTLLKNKLSAESFAKLSTAIPDADEMMQAAAASSAEESGSVLDTVKGAVSKIFGGSPEASLAKLGQIGLSVDQIQAFLPKVIEALSGRLPDNVVNQISGLLPTPQAAAHD